MFNLTMNTLHLAPLQNPRYALDIGTGTGIWAVDFGEYCFKHYFLLQYAYPSCSGPISQMRGTACLVVNILAVVLTTPPKVIGTDLSPGQPSLYAFLPGSQSP